VKTKYDKFWILGLTALFFLLGVFVIYFSYIKVSQSYSCNINNVVYSSGKVIDGYKEGYICSCESSEVICTKIEEKPIKPTLDQFIRTNLKVTPKYLVLGSKDEISSLPLKTKFTSVSVKKDVIDVTIEQEQLCSADLRVPVQIGMYYYSKGNLYLINVINKSPKLYTEVCTVSVNYKISKWTKPITDLNIIYLNEEGLEQKAVLCSYENNLYSHGDVYTANDNCNICKCVSGVSKCTNDRVCK
jgi:hypothetical protein